MYIQLIDFEPNIAKKRKVINLKKLYFICQKFMLIFH